MKPYLIWTPPYQHNSGGIVALHNLAHGLNGRGYTAYKNCDDPPAHIDPFTIAVYPEIVFGNPFQAINRVRWVLNVPGFIGGPKTYDPEELVFVWSKRYLDTPDDRILQVKKMEDDLFNMENTGDRSVDRFWYGKGRNKGIPHSPVTAGMEEITYSWPPTRKELADLLKRTRILYTYDDTTQLNWEAVLCGCRIILLPQGKELTLQDVGEADDYDKQLINFISITQKWAKGAT